VLFQRYFENTRWIRDPTRGADRDRLLRYEPIFEKYAERYGFDWLAIAAQAYQESRLEPGRKSPQGALGLMQILPSTAAGANVGIPDISTPERNIHAGVKYMAFLRDRYFSDPSVGPAARFDLSLAAYNMGPARVIELRRKTREMGLDPDVWFDNVEVAARRDVGREPVRYVANVNKYYVAYKLMQARLRELEARRP
jgi:membrane-bound lytic murein transglycosylase MltF